MLFIVISTIIYTDFSKNIIITALVNVSVDIDAIISDGGGKYVEEDIDEI